MAGEEVAGEEEAAAGDEEEEAAAGDEEEEEDNLVGATALTCSKSKLRLLKGKTLVHLYIVRMKVDLCLICALRWDVI